MRLLAILMPIVGRFSYRHRHSTSTNHRGLDRVGRTFPAKRFLNVNLFVRIRYMTNRSLFPLVRVVQVSRHVSLCPIKARIYVRFSLSRLPPSVQHMNGLRPPVSGPAGGDYYPTIYVKGVHHVCFQQRSLTYYGRGRQGRRRHRGAPFFRPTRRGASFI